jgi:hypothetical protein
MSSGTLSNTPVAQLPSGDDARALERQDIRGEEQREVTDRARCGLRIPPAQLPSRARPSPGRVVLMPIEFSHRINQSSTDDHRVLG